MPREPMFFQSRVHRLQPESTHSPIASKARTVTRVAHCLCLRKQQLLQHHGVIVGFVASREYKGDPAAGGSYARLSLT